MALLNPQAEGGAPGDRLSISPGIGPFSKSTEKKIE